MKTKRFTPFSYKGLRDASFIIQADGTECIAGIETQSQKSALIILNADFYATPNDANPISEISRLTFTENTLAFSPIDAGKGTIAYIESQSGIRNIVIYDPLTGEKKQVIFENGTPNVIRYLNNDFSFPDTPKITFAWSDMDSLYRFGSIDLITKNYILQETNISGGIHYPVLFNNTIYYNSIHTNFEKIQYLLLENILASSVSAGTVTLLPITPDIQIHITLDNIVKPYKPLSYMFNGTLAPLAAFSFTSQNNMSIMPGLMYATGDPAEKWQFTGTLLFNTHLFFLDTALSLMNTATPCQWSVVFTDTSSQLPATHTNADTIRNTTLLFNNSITHSLQTLYNRFTFTNSFSLDIHSEPFTASEHTHDFSVYTLSPAMISTQLLSGITFSNVHKTGLSSFDIAGIQSGIQLQLFFPVYKRKDESGIAILNDKGFFAQNLFAAAYIPHLLPFTNHTNFTFTLPTDFGISYRYANADVFSPSSDFAFTTQKLYEVSTPNVFKVTVHTILFGMEIQKGIPFLPLYVNRFVLSAGYNGNTYISKNFQNILYADSVQGGAKLVFSPLLGTVTSIKFDAGLTMQYLIRTGEYQIQLTSAINF